MKKKLFVLTFFWLIVFVTFASISQALTNCGDDANPAFVTICEIIMLLQGRIGRSIAMFTIMLSAWQFTSGQLKWQEIVQVAIGIGIFFAPKTFALFLLPDYIEGISGNGYDSSMKYTPDEILTCVCPNLR